MRAVASRHASWIVLGVALLLLAVVTFVGSNRSSTSAMSSTSARPDGALALTLWLQHLGYSVRTTGDSFPQPIRAQTVMVLQSGSDIPTNHIPPLLSWVRAGGRLVVATDGVTGSRLLAALRIMPTPAPLESVRIDQPVLLAPPVHRIVGATDLVIAGRSDAAVALGTASGPVLEEVRLGNGTVWVLSDPALLDNGDIGTADNGTLALNLAGVRGSAVLLATTSGEDAAPVGDWLTETVWGAAALFVFVVLLLYRFLTGLRLGPPRRLLEGRVRSTSEYVVSMAGLLQRTGRQADVLAPYRREIRRVFNSRYCGSLEELDAETRAQVEGALTPATGLTEAQLIERARDAVQCEERLRRGYV